MTLAALDMTPQPLHQSVLVDEVVAALVPVAGGLYLDVTAGWGGHSAALLAAQPDARVVAFDRDEQAVAAARERLAEFPGCARVEHLRFGDLGAWLEREQITGVDGLLADLGVSSPQLDWAERGMTFRKEGPLDMRMDQSRGKTARQLLAELSQDELADVIYNYGEERRSRRVARCIKQAIEDGELETTLDLRRAVVRAVGPRRVGGVDPATRTFQALRIAVNEELAELETLLALAPRIVKPGGTAAIISFHSLEDRQVKRAFLDRGVWQRLSKKPIVAGERERDENPRARSAKLRAARRLEPEAAGAREGRN